MNQAILAQAQLDLFTISDFVRFGVTLFEQAGCFYGHGTNNPLDDAAAIVCGVLMLDPDQINVFKDANLCSDEKKQILALFDRRVTQKVPAVYLTHKTWFAQLPFYVDERVIIPRSPLAEVIESSFSPWFKQDDIQSILDLCTGSGCLAIASAFYCPKALVDAIDIDPAALEVAKINLENHKLQDRVHFAQSDLFQAVVGKTYDIIISNPPYVSELQREKLPLEYHHEPEHALFTKDDGIHIAVKILESALSYLNPGGILIVEVCDAEELLQKRYPKIPFVWLEFTRGGGGVFQMDYDTLKNNEKYFQRVKSNKAK